MITLMDQHDHWISSPRFVFMKEEERLKTIFDIKDNKSFCPTFEEITAYTEFSAKNSKLTFPFS